MNNAWKVIVLILLSFTAGAQVKKEAIVTDRPDQTESPSLVPKGGLQVEIGFAMEKDRYEGIRTTNVAYNSTLIKYGVNSNLELRFISEYLGQYERNDVNRLTDRNGFSPIALGVKIKLSDENGYWPQAGLISHIVLKSGHREFSPTYTAANFRFTFCHTLSDKFSLSYNLGVRWDGRTPEATFLYTLSLGYELSPKAAVFVESYSFFTEGGRTDHRFDGGFTYKLTPVIQLDLSAGTGLNRYAPDYFVSAGISFRLFK
jgi:hypothetical protein